MASAAGSRAVKQGILSLEEARGNRVRLSWPADKSFPGLAEIFDLPENSGSAAHIVTLNNYPMNRVVPRVDWTSFVQTWDLAANTCPSAYEKTNRKKAEKALQRLREDAMAMLDRIISENILSLRGAAGVFPACSELDDIILFYPGKDGGERGEEAARFIFPRNQERKKEGEPNPCLADFILPRELFEKRREAMAPNPAALLGLYALSAGFGLREAEEEYRNAGDDYGALLLAGLAGALAEAFSEEIHQRLSNALNASAAGIRPAFGGPACPDHGDKETAFALLDAEKRCGLSLTDTAMIVPAASACGMYIAHPDSFYFSIGYVGEDQFNDWAGRKGLGSEEAGRRLGLL